MYIQSWSLMGRNGAGQPWITLSQGGFPNSNATDLSLDFFGTDLRVVASASNWIGIYDLQINVPVRLQNLTASANMQEVPNPSFGPAANLVDGNLSTSAYPGSASLDYDRRDRATLSSAYHLGSFRHQRGGATLHPGACWVALDGLTWEVILRAFLNLPKHSSGAEPLP
jgi:hypothetical protein